MELGRRQLLKGGLAALGAAVGLVGASRIATSGPVPEPRTTELLLQGRNWRLTSSSSRRGEMPGRGDRLVATGDLVEADGTTEVGQFHGTFFAVDSPRQAGPGGTLSIEMHTFLLPDGIIIGSGTGTSSPDTEDVFAILGGTERYTGVGGSYVARQRPFELGGDGSAEFRFTLNA